MSTSAINFNSENICKNYGIVHREILLHTNLNYIFLQSNGISCSSLVFYVMYSNGYCNTSLLFIYLKVWRYKRLICSFVSADLHLNGVSIQDIYNRARIFRRRTVRRKKNMLISVRLG